MKKLFSLFSIAFVFLFSLTACYPKWVHHAPDCQPLSHWESEDGRVIIDVPNPSYTGGTLMTEEGLIEVEFIFHSVYGDIKVYPIGCENEIGQIDYSKYEPLEEWKTDFRHHGNRFEVTVSESTYFTPGEKFTIYRTVKGISDEEYLKLYNSGD